MNSSIIEPDSIGHWSWSGEGLSLDSSFLHKIGLKPQKIKLIEKRWQSLFNSLDGERFENVINRHLFSAGVVPVHLSTEIVIEDEFARTLEWVGGSSNADGNEHGGCCGVVIDTTSLVSKEASCDRWLKIISQIGYECVIIRFQSKSIFSVDLQASSMPHLKPDNSPTDYQKVRSGLEFLFMYEPKILHRCQEEVIGRQQVLRYKSIHVHGNLYDCIIVPAFPNLALICLKEKISENRKLQQVIVELKRINRGLENLKKDRSSLPLQQLKYIETIQKKIDSI